MITVFLRGGLGNQMFQYALGLNLARRNHTELRLDAVFLNDRFPRRQFTYRTYDLDVFDIVPPPQFTALSKISAAAPIPGLWLGVDLALIRTKDIFGTQKLIKEKKEGVFDNEVFDGGAACDMLLYGFWQSPKYFAGAEEELKKIFQFKKPLQGESVRIAEEIKSANSVSLHVRRGDYIKFSSMKAAMGDTDAAYYQRAAVYMQTRVPDAHFFVFSDDLAWCRENLELAFPVTYMDQSSQGPKSIYHLELMSLCKHNIIANSTFSWWGAWLNRNPGKIVVAPKRWHADRGDAQNDIVPEAWVML